MNEKQTNLINEYKEKRKRVIAKITIEQTMHWEEISKGRLEAKS